MTAAPHLTADHTAQSRNPSERSLFDLIGLDDEAFTRVDPLEMNLLVAKGIPALADLDITRYQRFADEWAASIRQRVAKARNHFWRNPADWKNDIRFFQLGVLCQFVECELGVRYREDHREVTEIRYTNPSDLFLNGVMDTRRGTCGNMAALHVALGWRLGWPVSLACVGSHFICRFDDGEVTHNIEATQSDFGGFKSDPDEFLMRQHRLPEEAVRCGSDLRAVTPRELLGTFIGLRARHERDTGQDAATERDLLLARYLFPAYRVNCREQVAATVASNAERFAPSEAGHPNTLGRLANEVRAKQQNAVPVPPLRPAPSLGGPVICAAPPFIHTGTLSFAAGDTNLYRYVGNDPTGNTDPSGLLGITIVELLVQGGNSAVVNRFSTLEQAQATAAYKEIALKAQVANMRIAPHAILAAVKKALADLGVQGVEPKLGDHIKAKLSAADYAKVKKALDDKLEEITTKSAESAARACIDKKWELKLYKTKEGDYQAAVGFLTESFAHKLDFLDWFLSEKLGSFVSQVPNGANAEQFLKKAFYDATALQALSNFKKMGFLKQTPFDSVLAEYLKSGIDPGVKSIDLPEK